MGVVAIVFLGLTIVTACVKAATGAATMDTSQQDSELE